MKQIILSKGEIVLVDDEDFTFLSQFKWHAVDGYVRRMKQKNNKRWWILMHRVVMNAPDDMDVDHINHNPLDNRKKNLRICTTAQNGANQKISKKNTSGLKGVYWRKDRNKWRAEIKVNQKNLHLGYFIDKKLAAQAYNEAAKSYFGEFSFLNKI